MASSFLRFPIVLLTTIVYSLGGMARIFTFTIFARFLLPHGHFSSKFTKLSFIRYFSTFMSIFTKKYFRWCSVLGDSQDKDFFFWKIVHAKKFKGFISQYFFKILKGGVRRVLAASNLLLGVNVWSLLFWPKCQNMLHFYISAPNIKGIKISTPPN